MVVLYNNGISAREHDERQPSVRCDTDRFQILSSFLGGGFAGGCHLSTGRRCRNAETPQKVGAAAGAVLRSGDPRAGRSVCDWELLSADAAE